MTRLLHSGMTVPVMINHVAAERPKFPAHRAVGGHHGQDGHATSQTPDVRSGRIAFEPEQRPAKSPVYHRTNLIPMLACLLGACIAFATPARALDYTLAPPPAELTADLAASFTLTCEEPIRLEPPPAHPRIDWLPATIEIGGQKPAASNSITALRKLVDGTQAQALKTGRQRATFEFVPRGTGTITPPAVPIILGGRRILLRLPVLTVKPNPMPEGTTELIALWNGKRRQPKTLTTGESIDLEILALLPATSTPRYPYPKLEIEPSRWFRGVNPSGPTSTDTRFLRFGYRSYEQQKTEFRGKQCHVRRYKSRFTVLPGERLKGVIGITLRHRNFQRTHVETIDLPITPLPPVPSGGHIPTGLLGNWSFECSFEPATPVPGQPFTITLGIDGTGDPQLMRELDFSRPGFRSTGTTIKPTEESKVDHYRAQFTQTLVADNNASTFPAIKLLSFDSTAKQWKIHQLSDALQFSAPGALAAGLTPVEHLGNAIRRPILLNLHPATFAALGLAPLLTILAALIARQRSKRDPSLTARRHQSRQLLRELERADDAEVPALLEDHWLPLLRARCHLPDGASTRELASTLDAEHPELAKLLRSHADTTFAGKPSPATRQALAPLLARLSFSLLLLLSLVPDQARAGETEEALHQAAADFAAARYEEAAIRYQTLLTDHPGHPELHLNLARARLADNQLHLARASAHTAFLLDPRNKASRQVLDTTLHRLGSPPLPGSAALALRPDQLLTLGAAAWGLAFLLLALRRFISLPRWPAITCFATAALFLSTALWRNSHAYAPDQFMVISPEVIRETNPGKPDFDRPPLNSGTIVRATSTNDSGSHLRIVTPDTTFWLPAAQLQQVW